MYKKSLGNPTLNSISQLRSARIKVHLGSDPEPIDIINLYRQRA